MTFEDMDNEELEFEVDEAQPLEEESNRTFIIVAGILGGVTILALVCIAIFATVILPRQRAQREANITQLTATAEYIEFAIAGTKTAAVQALAAAPTDTPPPPTPTRTPTPVVVVPTNTSVPTQDPRTATVAALFTQAAVVTQTVVSPSATALPTTGFVDDLGVSGLLGMAVLLIAVIFLSRRLRST